jgi:hypothetical protein
VTGWWEETCLGTFEPATASPHAGGGPGAGDFLCSPKESHQRKGNPRFAATTRNLVWCPCAAQPAWRSAQLAHRSRNSKHIRREITAETQGYARLAQCSPETPGWSALLGGEQGPRDQKPSCSCPAVVEQDRFRALLQSWMNRKGLLIAYRNAVIRSARNSGWISSLEEARGVSAIQHASKREIN